MIKHSCLNIGLPERKAEIDFGSFHEIVDPAYCHRGLHQDSWENNKEGMNISRE